MRNITIVLLSVLYLSLTSQTNNYYFGNLHSHTGFSDGSVDSSSSGVSNPLGAYAFAKLSQHFDFLGISEHNHYSSAHTPGFKLPLYQKGLDMADTSNNHNSPFLSLFGMEWGVTTQFYGHVVIYGFNQLIGWETSVPGVTGANYNIYNAKADYDGLFKKIKNNPNAFCYLAHPNIDDFTKTGSGATALAYSAYNATYDSAIVGVPLRNGPAFSTFTSYTDYATGDYFSYYKKLLSIGYHVGIGYDQDNHYTTFGRSNAGRLVIIAPSLTKANLFAAMQNMHFYGSDDWNAKIDFNLNGNIMGSILNGTFAPTFNVIHNDGDGEQAATINIWKGNANTMGAYPLIVYSSANNNTATFTDLNLAGGVEYYYFAEIKQADGDWIVTSPIWYKSTGNQGTVSLKEETNEIKFNYFPNPVSKNLNISTELNGSYSVSIIDISGRIIFNQEYNEKNIVIDLSPYRAGLYSLNLKTDGASVLRRLIVE